MNGSKNEGRLQRVVSKTGIRFQGRAYISASLSERRGERVSVALGKSPGPHLEVFTEDGEWVCRATTPRMIFVDERINASTEDLRQRRKVFSTIAKLIEGIGDSKELPDGPAKA